jgi:hypothetical protein
MIYIAPTDDFINFEFDMKGNSHEILFFPEDSRNHKLVVGHHKTGQKSTLSVRGHRPVTHTWNHISGQPELCRFESGKLLPFPPNSSGVPTQLSLFIHALCSTSPPLGSITRFLTTSNIRSLPKPETWFRYVNRVAQWALTQQPANDLLQPYLLVLQMFAGDSRNQNLDDIVVRNVLHLRASNITNPKPPSGLQNETLFHIFANFVPFSNADHVIKEHIKQHPASKWNVIDRLWPYLDPIQIGHERTSTCCEIWKKALGKSDLNGFVNRVPIGFLPYFLGRSGWGAVGGVFGRAHPLTKAFDGVEMKFVPEQLLLSFVGKVCDGVLIEPDMDDEFNHQKQVLFPGDRVQLPGISLVDDRLPGVIPYGGEAEIRALLPFPPIVKEENGPYRRLGAGILTPVKIDAISDLGKAVVTASVIRPLVDFLRMANLQDDMICVETFRHLREVKGFARPDV